MRNPTNDRDRNKQGDENGGKGGRPGEEAPLDFVRAMHEAKKPIAFICHAGWVPISAGIVRGRTVTSVSAIKDDLINAGATWVDQEVVVDGNLITSRTPPDLPAFARELVRMLARVKVG